MAEALHALSVRAALRQLARPGLAPMVTLAVFALPILAGLLGTLLPAFGYLPALGGQQLSLSPWRTLLSTPGLVSASLLTLSTGWLSTILALALALGCVAAMQQRDWGRAMGRTLAPLLATPHSALAIGFGFLIAPSGWIVRMISPGLTGWELPPDVATIGHPSGWPIVIALLLKEVPYLILMLLAALNQVPARTQLASARSMGYAPASAWLLIVLPQVYAQIRLPVYAVLAFSLSVVDVALVLGPGNPPTLAVMAVRWLSNPDSQSVFPASAAAILLFVIVVVSIGLWRGAEVLAGRALRAQVERGVRGQTGTRLAGSALIASVVLLLSFLMTTAALMMWSFAERWRYPDALPSAWMLTTWRRQSANLLDPALTSLIVGLVSTAIALFLTLACLENEARSGTSRRAPSLSLLYLPLLVPQVAFLFGLQVLFVRMGADGGLPAVVWAHLVFVLPYLFLSLKDQWRAYDMRYSRTALSLGASPIRVFWKIKLPILLKPILSACAIAFAVSVGQYLPTLFAGAGRVATLTTEAVTLSSGADRRVIAAWALTQALMPFAVFGVAALIPRLLYRKRKALI